MHIKSHTALFEALLHFINVNLITTVIIIQLKARLQLNIGFTLWHVLAVLTHSAITTTRVN